MKTENIVRFLTICSLAGLLTATGMRLTVEQVVNAMRKRRLTLVAVVNFVIVPALVLAATQFCGLETEVSVGMILLAAAPFAPVVPVFARMARADLALAAGLTALFPLLSMFLTPLACQVALAKVPHLAAARFDVGNTWLILVA